MIRVYNGMYRVFKLYFCIQYSRRQNIIIYSSAVKITTVGILYYNDSDGAAAASAVRRRPPEPTDGNALAPASEDRGSDNVAPIRTRRVVCESGVCEIFVNLGYNNPLPGYAKRTRRRRPCISWAVVRGCKSESERGVFRRPNSSHLSTGARCFIINYDSRVWRTHAYITPPRV